MEQNLKDIFKNEPENQTTKMSEGHQARFSEKLDITLYAEQKLKINRWLTIAASLVVLLGLSYGTFSYFNNSTTNTFAPNNSTEVATPKLKTMGDISPDLKKVEDYYLASINLELSKVKLTPENKELFDGYIARLKELNTEYQKLTVELNENGPNEATLDALIENLKFRLNFVMRLKEKLQEFNDDVFIAENA